MESIKKVKNSKEIKQLPQVLDEGIYEARLKDKVILKALDELNRAHDDLLGRVAELEGKLNV